MVEGSSGSEAVIVVMNLWLDMLVPDSSPSDETVGGTSLVVPEVVVVLVLGEPKSSGISVEVLVDDSGSD